MMNFVILCKFVSDLFHDVKIEPHLLPLKEETFALRSSETDDEARLDIKASGLWESKFNEAYFDIVINWLAKICPESSSEAHKFYESF